MGIFKRLFKIGEANVNSAIDNLEDPIKMTEQGIRDLKVDLDKSLQALAEVKALLIRTKNEAQQNKAKALEYEQKAIMLVQSASNGKIPAADADRLATEALNKKEEAARAAVTSDQQAAKLDTQVNSLEANVKKLKNTITSAENELKTLKARVKVSEATKNVNKQLANIDSSSTINMLEKMKEKVEKEEALAEAYGDMADGNKNLDEEINSVLSNSTGSDALAALKAKLGQNQLTGDTPPALT